MKRDLIYAFMFLLLGGLMLNTCHKEYFELDRLSDEVELETGLIAPLVYGSLSINDILELIDSTEYIGEFEDGLVYLTYSDTAYSVRADTVVDVPDQMVAEYYIEPDIMVPIWLGAGIGDTIPFFKSEFFDLNFDGDSRIDSIFLKQGDIVIDIRSTFEHMGTLTISSPQVFDSSRDTFTTVFDISDLSGNFTAQQVIPTDGYFISVTEENDTSFQINFKLELYNSGNPINPDDSCTIETNFLNMGFYKAFGHVGARDLITETGSFEIPIFDDNPELASIIFRDPRIDLFTSSSVGIPLEVELDSVIATSSRDGSKVELAFTSGHPFQIAAPGIEEIGSRVESEIHIDRNTSNIDQLLASAPSEIAYKIVARTLAGTGEEEHFVLDTSAFDVSMELLLPLDFKSTGFAFEDTIKGFEVGNDGVDTSMIKSAIVTVETINELPVELELQLYLLDSMYTVIDSIFDEREVLLGASQVEQGTGTLLEATEEVNSIDFPASKLARLKDVFFLQVEARLVTSESGQEFVKIYSHYTLDFKISMEADVRINSREL